MSVLLTRYGGWSNHKRFVKVRRLAETAGNDQTAVAATVALTGAALVSCLVLPRPRGLVIATAALATIGIAWRRHLDHQPVSLLIERRRWEQFRHELTTSGNVTVDIGRLAKAVDQDGMLHDVLLTCQRRDVGALRRALRMEPET